MPLLLGLAGGAQAQATLSISSGPADANEGNSGTRDLTYTVSLSQPRSANVHWRVCFTGTATRETGLGAIGASADYQGREGSNQGNPISSNCTSTNGLGSGGSTSNSNILIRVKGDTDPEPDETVIATLSFVGPPPSDVTLGTSTHTHTILNDDTVPPVAVWFASASSSAGEGAGTRNIGVNLNPGPTSAITLGYGVGGTATSGSDFTALSGTVSVTSGATSVNIAVAITDDSAVENPETVTLTLTDGSGYTVGSTNRHTLTITDNDATQPPLPPPPPPSSSEDSGSSSPPPPPPPPAYAAPPPGVSLADATVAEGGLARFVVRLPTALTHEVGIEWVTASATARAGQDYEADRGVLLFPAGATSRTIAVQTLADADEEGDEQFTVRLVNTHEPVQATGTIRDGAAPQPNAEDSSGNGNATAVDPARPRTLTKVAGDAQQGPAGGALAAPLVAAVLDQNGDPLAGVDVTFAVVVGGGMLAAIDETNPCTVVSATSSATATTDANGQAATRLTLGRQPGPNAVEATIAGLKPVTFTATAAEQAIPHSLTKVCGDDQAGTAGALLAEPFVVSVGDEDGAAIGGVDVTFAVVAGGGTLSSATATTNANGRARTWLTLGGELGPNAVEATIAGLEPVTFTALGQESPLVSMFEAFWGSGKRVAVPDSPQLAQNAPNPFNSETVLAYFLREPGLMRLEVFTLTGQRVAVLQQGPQQAGYHRLAWDGRDAAGHPVASGVYLYRLVTNEIALTRKLILLR